jgi:type VI secretion system protein ImpG
MESLLRDYERELALLRRYASDFAARYPKIATRFGISGEHSEDPHVERMLQSFAFLSARIDARLEDDYPEFTEALLEILYPDYLRPFPSCSMVQFDIFGLFEQLTEAVTVKRLTELESKAGAFRFRTTYDVRLAPLKIGSARYASSAAAPAMAQLPAGTTSIVSIEFERGIKETVFNARNAGVARVHLHGQRLLVAALTDAMLLRASAAFVEGDTAGVWTRVPALPVRAVGFAEDESATGSRPAAGVPFGLLLEYFAFPEKFDFVDVDLAALARVAGPSRRLVLHLALGGIQADSQIARILETVTADNFKLFCTPIVNLFEREAEPMQWKDPGEAHSVVPRALQASTTEVYSIDAVYSITQASDAETRTPIPAYHALSHGETRDAMGVFWVAKRDPQIAQQQPGYETLLSLVHADAKQVPWGINQVGADLTCMNRNAPTLPQGLAEGDLLNEHAAVSCPIMMLRRPTAIARMPRGHGELWSLISRATSHPMALGGSGAAELKQMLRQHAAAAPMAARHIDGIVDLAHRAVMRRMPVKPFPAFVRGIEVQLSVDESQFAGNSLAIFIGLMDKMFACYAHANSFVELVVLSIASGTEIKRCQPNEGLLPLL